MTVAIVKNLYFYPNVNLKPAKRYKRGQLFLFLFCFPVGSSLLFNINKSCSRNAHCLLQESCTEICNTRRSLISGRCFRDVHNTLYKILSFATEWLNYLENATACKPQEWKYAYTTRFHFKNTLSQASHFASLPISFVFEDTLETI